MAIEQAFSDRSGSKFRQRMRLLRLLGRAGPGRVVPLALIYAASAAVPLSIAFATGWLVSSAIAQVRAGTPDLVGLVAPLLAVGFLLILEQVLPALAIPLELAAAREVEGEVHREIRSLAMSSPTIRPLENPQLHDNIEIALGTLTYIRSGDRTLGSGATSQLNVIVRVFAAAIACILLARFSPWLAAALFAATWFLEYKLTGLYWDWEAARTAQAPGQRWARYWSEMAGGPQSAKEIRIFGLADWLVNRYQTLAFSARAQSEGLGLGVVRSNWWSFVAQFALLAATFVFLGLAAIRGELTPGELTTYVQLSFAAIYLQSGGSLAVEAALVFLQALDKVEAIARADISPRPAGGVVPAQQPQTIRFENVCFRYTPDSPFVLEHLNLEIPAGESLAIVGVNGAGKTTLIKLLTGLYEPDEGRILVDGVDLRDIDRDWWRSQFGVTFQDFVAYPLTARENVLLGTRQKGGNGAELAAAAQLAGAAPVVEKLSNGWDTVLSRRYEGGSDLSGGEWQRIVLARTLYAERAGAAVLVLDEPTANLDPRGEAEIFATLLDHSHAATRIVVSHRLSSVRNADRIVLLKDGRIAESGTHDELMSLQKDYAEMFEIQAARFREAEAAGEGK